MTFSVWNYRSGRYDYYETPNSINKGAVAPDHVRSAPRCSIGIAADDAGWPVPPHAKRTGSGIQARGTIASAPIGQALGGTDGSSTSLVKLGLVALGIYFVAR